MLPGEWYRSDPPQAAPATRPLPAVRPAEASTPSGAEGPAPWDSSGGTPGAGGRLAGHVAGAASWAWQPRVISPLWQVAVILVALAGIIGVTLGVVGGGRDDRGGSEGGGDTEIGVAGAGLPREQAKALDRLLSHSSDDRNAVVNAVVSLKGCRNLAAATATLGEAAANRTAFVTKLETVQTSQVPGGGQLKRTLRTAWQSSADADRAFARWGKQIAAAGCPGGQPKVTAAYRRGAKASATASRAKKSFVTQWNTVAGRYGLERREPRDI